MTIVDAVDLIQQFRDFCLTKGDCAIQHQNPDGYADWNSCAVGQFAKIKAAQGWGSSGDYMSYKLTQAFHALDPDSHFMSRLGSVEYAKEHVPTFSKLAKALTVQINHFTQVVE